MRSDSYSLTNESAVKRYRAKMAEIRHRYPGLHRAISMNTSMHPNCRCVSIDLADDAKTTPISWSLYGNVIQKTPRTFDYPFGPVPPLPASTAINLTELLASGQARRVNDHAVEIVTPGYFNDSQGDAMPSYGCGDPGCPQCNPSATSKNSVSLGSMPSWFGTGTITIAYDTASPAKQNKEQSMSSSTTQRVIADLQSLDEKDFPVISKEIDKIKGRNKGRILEGLDGLVTLEQLKDTDIRRFVLAYYQNDEAKTAKGVEFGDTGKISEEDEEKAFRVFVEGRDYPACGTKFTMSRLRKTLDGYGIPYRIAYYTVED